MKKSKYMEKLKEKAAKTNDPKLKAVIEAKIKALENQQKPVKK